MHIVIIGNGIAGITTARYIRKLSSEYEITVISAETKYFYSRPALMYIYMGHLTRAQTQPYEDWFWAKNRINLIHGYAQQIDFEAKKVLMASEQVVPYDKLVLATGSASNKFGWKGQDLLGVQGLYNMQDLDLMEDNTRNISRGVIVGGGLIGIEMAEMLLSRQIPVTMLVRENSFWNNVLPPEESSIINHHIKEHHIDLRLSTELKEIIPDKNGRVKAVRTNKGDTIDCQFVGLTAGVHPNIGFVKNTALETNRGILVNHYLETNLPDVYAIGDCAQFQEPLPNRRPIEQVWYTGRMQGITVAHTICGDRKIYQPRLWFNSAKFLDIEYQTYGTVLNKLQDGEAQFYWEHEDGKKCVKIVFEESSQKVLGVNTLGVRFRHDVWEQWLNEGRDLPYIMQHLKASNFDPELYEQYEEGVVATYNKQFPNQQIKLKSKRSLFNMIFG